MTITDSQWEPAGRVDRYVQSGFFYKNLFYKNVEAEFCLKFKNILRTFTQVESQLRTIFIPTKCF